MQRLLLHLRQTVGLFESNPGTHYLPELFAALGHVLEADPCNEDAAAIARKLWREVRGIPADKRQRAVTGCVATLMSGRCNRDYTEAFDIEGASPHDALRWIRLGASRFACKVDLSVPAAA